MSASENIPPCPRCGKSDAIWTPSCERWTCWACAFRYLAEPYEKLAAEVARLQAESDKLRAENDEMEMQIEAQIDQ